MIVDVNELQRAEKAAKEARDYAELLFKMTPSCIFTVDIDRKNNKMTLTYIIEGAKTEINKLPDKLYEKDWCDQVKIE